MKAYLTALLLFFTSWQCLKAADSTLVRENTADPVSLWHKANMAYQQQQYQNAIELYSDIVSKGIQDPDLYYNLAGAYYKDAEYSKAILNYERALKRDPADEDIRFNLQVANLHAVDRIDPIPEIFYKRWLKAFAAGWSTGTWSVLLIAAFWITMAGLYLFVCGNTSARRKSGFFTAASGTILVILLLIITRESHYLSNTMKEAIITTPSVYVKSSPDDKGNDLFILHECTKVEIMDQLNDWRKVRLANGSIGWLKQQEIEII
ncbi:MAG: tetratricopeptide repeat protein [Bacteroidia bacterium]|nr:tetratricopeptide repeat protein [Bacteroidia bacterium]